jgi:cation:H+ antiporter
LIISSRILVWGAVKIAHGLGVSDLIIGLTIVAVGTSLPELASSIIATCRGEHDIALGNVLGSNLFNTLAVVGIAGAIHPQAVGPEVFNRDMMVMAALTLSLFIIGYGFRGPGRINLHRLSYQHGFWRAGIVQYIADLGKAPALRT